MAIALTLGLLTMFVVSICGATYLMIRRNRIAVERLAVGFSSVAAVSRPDSLWDRLRQRFMAGVSETSWRRMTRIPLNLKDVSEIRKLLHHAGFRSESGLLVFQTIRTAVAFTLPIVFILWSLHSPMPHGARLACMAVLFLVGHVIPKFVVRSLARRRQHRLRLSLPDALDLLVVCVEAGMGLNQALVKVAEELEFTHPEISEELKLVNVELRAGRSRAEALRNLGERTGVDDIMALAAMLIQADRFGTSIARSLRVHSDSLRTERIQRAEEAAAKTTIKLIFPLMFCIFPALLTVILGPAFMNLSRIFGETFAHTVK